MMTSDLLTAELPLEKPEKPEKLATGVKKRNPIDPITNVKTIEMRFMVYEDLLSARLICAHLGMQDEWRFHQAETNPLHQLH